MKARNVTACLAGNSRHDTEKVTGTGIGDTPTGRYSVTESVRELYVLDTGTVDEAPELMRQAVSIGSRR
jgi:hypothetical protein